MSATSRSRATVSPSSGRDRRLAGEREIDARGLAVAPGFINMLSWSTESLIQDGRGQSEIRQGVTLEVMGEGWSMGPLNDEMKRLEASRQGDIRFPIEWTSLGEYLEHLERRGIAPNVASFVGATTVRIHELGEGDVDPDARAAGADARARPPGDERGRDGRRQLAHLCARRTSPRPTSWSPW